MARLKPKSYPNRVWHGRGFSVRVVVSRVDVGNRAFKACAFIGTKNNWNERGRTTSHCGVGKNPRAAAAGALRTIAKRLVVRSGAFAGLKGGKK